MALIGNVDKATRSYVAGWVANPEHPRQPVDVLIYVNGEGRGRVTADLMRNDLKAAFPGATGNHAFRFEFGWPLSPFQRNDIEILDSTDRQPLVGGKVALLPQGGRQGSGPMPIFVTSTGRSGSSLLMGRLAACPEIAVAGSHPYEVKQLTYYSGALRTLSLEANGVRSMNPDTLLSEASRYVIGYNPFHDSQFAAGPLLDRFWNVTGPQILTSAFREMVIQYYEAVREMTHKECIRYIAEKAHPNPLVRDGVVAMFGGIKEILLVRDPRDLVCSYRSFWGAKPSDAVSLIRSQFTQIVSRAAGRTPDTLLVKYEDLVLYPVETLATLREFLSLSQASANTDLSEHTIFGMHGTSKSPAESIGRWRQELTPEERTACNTAFGDFLPVLGYECE